MINLNDDNSQADSRHSLIERVYPEIQKELNLQGITPTALLHDHLHKYYSTRTLAPALLATDPTTHSDTFLKLMSCSDNVTISSTGQVYHHNRCNLRICPLCSSINAKQRAQKLKAVINSPDATFRLADTDNDFRASHKQRVVALALTLTLGTRCNTHEIRKHIQALNETWRRFIRSLPVARTISGYFKGVEVALEPRHDTISIHPHLHITALVNADKLSVDEAANHLKTLLPIWVNRARKVIAKLDLKTETKLAGQEVKPITEQTIEQLEGWLKYCSKGSITHASNKLRQLRDLEPERHADTWIELGSQLKNLRLTSDGGLLKESRLAYEETKAARQAQVDQIDSTHTIRRIDHNDSSTWSRHKPRVTHRWSHPESRWKAKDEYSTNLDCSPIALLQRGLLLTLGRNQLFKLWQQLVYRQNEAINIDLRRDEQTEQDKQRISMAYWVATGKAPNSMKVLA